MTSEINIIPIQALKCPHCEQVIKEKDYPDNADIDFCVYCGVKFINGNKPTEVVSHLQPVYDYQDYDHVRMTRRKIIDSDIKIKDIDNSFQNIVKENAEDIGFGVALKRLTIDELNKWKLGFKRTFDRPQIISNFKKHAFDLLLGAMIAKEQFNRTFDGSDPYSGRFGNSMIMPHHMGRSHWGVDAGEKHINISVLDKMVCVVTGYMDANSSGAIKQIRPNIDGKTKVWKYTQPNFASGEILDIDQGYILRNKSLYSLELKPRDLRKAQLQPIGMAYLLEELMREPRIGKEFGMIVNNRPKLEIIPLRRNLVKRETEKKKRWKKYIAYTT